MSTWIVMCRVSGGVTGTRQAPLKNADHQVKTFASRDDAQAEASRLLANLSPYRTASFQYWPEAQEEF